MKTVSELMEMLRNGEIKPHHSAYAKGYVSRKSEGIVEEYNGRFGKGYKVHFPLWSSTRFHKVVYVVFEMRCKTMELKMKKYVVTFITKKGGVQRWSINLSAVNGKMAIATARLMWDASTGGDMHLFDITAKRISDDSETLATFCNVTY